MTRSNPSNDRKSVLSLHFFFNFTFHVILDKDGHKIGVKSKIIIMILSIVIIGSSCTCQRQPLLDHIIYSNHFSFRKNVANFDVHIIYQNYKWTEWLGLHTVITVWRIRLQQKCLRHVMNMIIIIFVLACKKTLIPCGVKSLSETGHYSYPFLQHLIKHCALCGNCDTRKPVYFQNRYHMLWHSTHGTRHLPPNASCEIHQRDITILCWQPLNFC